MPENLTRGLFLHVEQVHLAAQLAVVALGGLFQHVQVRFELFLAGEGHAVDALQHCAVAVAAPIGAGDGHQLEGVARHLAGMLQVRATAQVLPVAMPIHAQRLIARDGVDQFYLIGLVVFGVEINRALTVPNLGGYGVALVDDLFHLLFDERRGLRA